MYFSSGARRLTSIALATVFVLGLRAVWPASAETFNRETINRGTVGVVAGEYGHLSMRLASDLAAVLDEGDKLRVLAVAGRGALSNIADMLFLRGIDVTIVSADVLDHAEKSGLFPGLKDKIHYVSRLYIQDIHLLASTRVRSIRDLQGQKINVVSKLHGAAVTARNLFGTLGIDYQPVYFDQRLAIEKIKRGEIAAAIVVSGRPNPLLAGASARDGLRFVPIPFTSELPNVYVPAKLSSRDYPNIVPAGQSVQTIGTTAVMLAFNFKPGTFRHAKINRFIDALLSRFDDLRKPPRHQRWKDVNLASGISGWNRFAPVAEWLKTGRPQAVALRKPKKKKRSLKELFQAFIDSEVTAGRGEQLLRLQKDQVFAKFLAWQKLRREGGLAKPKGKPKRSLKALFRQFIEDEVARVGKNEVVSLSKAELYQRFLSWQRRTFAQSAQ